METFVDKLRRDFPSIAFIQGSLAHWSATDQRITYTPTSSSVAIWTLLHELGHALLNHSSYTSDANLLQKEVEAWDTAKHLAQQYGLSIKDDHIQQCLDTYREWLHKRSACPACNKHGVQQPGGDYVCLNCHGRWRVTRQRFCRPYRLRKDVLKNLSSA